MTSTQPTLTFSAGIPTTLASSPLGSLSQQAIVENIAIDKHDVASAWLPTKYGKFRMHVFRGLEGEEADSVVLIYGEIKTEDVPLVRLHSECMTGDVFGSRKCDCGEQLNAALSMIVKEKAGILIYSRQEGRGIGLFNKIRAYELQDQGRDTIQANEDLGLPIDGRTYEPAAAMLKYLNVTKIRLITNNPAKAEALRMLKIDVLSTVGSVIPPHPENKDYLKIKELKMRHKFTSLVIPPPQDESKIAALFEEDSKQSTSVEAFLSSSSSTTESRRDTSTLVSVEAPPARNCKKRCNSDLDCYESSAKIQAV